MAVLTFMFVALVTGVASAGITWVGACTSWSYDDSATKRMVFELEQGTCEIVPYAADTVRVRWHWDGLWAKDEIALIKTPDDFPAFSWTNYTQNGKVYIELPELLVEVTLTPNFGVNYYDRTSSENTGFNMASTWRWEYDETYDPVSDGTYNNLRYSHQLPYNFKVKSLMEMPNNEAYFGLGSVPESLNHRGHDIQLWNSDSYGWGEGSNPLYQSFPFFYGMRPAKAGENPDFCYGIFFNNSTRTVFRFGTESSIPDKYSFEGGDGQIDYFFFAGGADHQMPAVLKRYSELTGTPSKLPKWTLGYQTCRWSYDNQSWVEWLAETFSNDPNKNFPLDCIYLDIDYMNADPNTGYGGEGGLHQLTFNSNFPDPAGMIDYCEDRGVKLVPLIEPWINRQDYGLWDEAANNLHFLKDYWGNQLVTSIYFGEVSWLDFTSSHARDWWKGKLKNFLAQYPVAGVWNDLNEPASMVDSGEDLIPRNGLFWMDGRFGDNGDSRRWSVNNHNTYCIYETMTTVDALQEQFPNRRPMVVSRAGYPGIQRYAMSWTGDNQANWASLRYSIRHCNNIMISGQANTGDDLGGFVMETTPELLTRWHQKATLNPLCRSHSQKSVSEREPFRYSATYYNAMKKTIEFRYKLMPYLYSLANESHETGMPMNAPVVMFDQEDTATFSTSQYEMMVGENLMAAPVYNNGARSRSVYLPKDSKWYYWPMGEGGTNAYAGGSSYTVSAPLDVLPMFVREGAIIPMGPRMQNVNEFQSGWLDVKVWPADEQTSFTLYEDDGETMEYETGNYAETVFTAQRTPNGMDFSSTARAGSYDPYTNGVRQLNLVAYDMDDVQSVTDNGTALTEYADWAALGTNTVGWYYNSSNRTAYVRVQDGTSHNIEARYAAASVDYTISVQTGDHGAVSPAGTATVAAGSNQLFQIQADDLYRIASVTADGAPISHAFGQAEDQYDYLWENVQSNGTLAVAFGPAMSTNAPEAVPHVWIDSYYPADTNFDLLAMSDTDGDGMLSWEEYVAGTDPTNMQSRFYLTIAGVTNNDVLLDLPYTKSGRVYSVYYSDVLTNGFEFLSAITNTGSGQMSFTNDTSKTHRFYKVEAELNK